MSLSLRRQEVLAKYRELETSLGRPPLLPELARAIGTCTTTAEMFIMRLRLSGHIGDHPVEPLALGLLGEADDFLGSVLLTNGDRQRVNRLRSRIAELLGRPFAAIET